MDWNPFSMVIRTDRQYGYAHYNWIIQVFHEPDTIPTINIHTSHMHTRTHTETHTHTHTHLSLIHI